MKPIERAIQYCKNFDNALDVGCGSGGRIIRKLLEIDFKIKSIDVMIMVIKKVILFWIKT
jgi:2-polyprenyl-3-methyl-5-hydroxy-6-metoxy-1,4-benzoquinol methylase